MKVSLEKDSIMITKYTRSFDCNVHVLPQRQPVSKFLTVNVYK